MRLLPYSLICIAATSFSSIFLSVAVGIFGGIYFPNEPYDFIIFAPVVSFGYIFVMPFTLFFACLIIHLINLLTSRLLPPVVAAAFIMSTAALPLCFPFVFSHRMYGYSNYFAFQTLAVLNVLLVLTYSVTFGIAAAEKNISRIKKPLPPFRVGIRSIMGVIVCIGVVSAIDRGSFTFLVPVTGLLLVNGIILSLHFRRNRNQVVDPKKSSEKIEPKKTDRLDKKSTVHEIRRRFDADVERFSNLETGQKSTIDAPLAMELITQAAIAATDPITKVLDIGSGAGNNSIKLRQTLETDFDVTFVDLSRPMLNKAKERFQEINTRDILLVCDDFRKTELQSESYDVVLAAAVLHHLRGDFDWRSTFAKIYRLLRPGGSVWITDLVDHESSPIQNLMWKRYGDYLEDIGGENYRQTVFDYIEKEDSPRSVTYQVNLLQEVGFSSVEILHKNSCFAAFGAIK